jgi:hypothetical protein
MGNPRRRRITLTHWLLVVVIAALVANAILQTISIMQRSEIMRHDQRFDAVLDRFVAEGKHEMDSLRETTRRMRDGRSRERLPQAAKNSNVIE